MQLALREHLGTVWRVLRRCGLGAADADDAAQDVFWILARRLGKVPPRAERYFLLSTALHVASDRRRSAWRRRVTEPLDPELADGARPSAEDELEHRRRRELLDAALDMLGEDERQVLVLADLEGLSREQSAEILGIAPGTVASRLRRARENLNDAVHRLQRLDRRRP